MTEAQKKAKELMNKFAQAEYGLLIELLPETYREVCKAFSILCVDEILKTCPQKENEIFGVSKGIEFWQEVRKEIINHKN